MALFDACVMVDWSAASKPIRGQDSIWIGIARPGMETTVENVATRADAVARLRALALAAVDAGERMLIGFDFPFGYPAGVAHRLTGEASALALWRWIAARLRDEPDNANNRYDVAAEINRAYPGIGPCWGRPASWDYPDVPTRGTARIGDGHPPELRLADARGKTGSTVWKLYTTGSVGSQVLTGLPAVLALRDDPGLKDQSGIWPFETGLVAPSASVVFAEIYPSLIPPDPAEDVRDAGQVRAVADWLSGLDRDNALGALFAGPSDASADERRTIVAEEAWILGLEAPTIRAVNPASTPAAPLAKRPPRLRYERDPAEIYRQSFATVRAETALDHLPRSLRDPAIRLVHACGMPEITARLAWSEDLADRAEGALRAGRPILCDCEMVGAGIIRRTLPKGVEPVVTLNHPSVPSRARDLGTTRSAAAVDLWADRIADSIVVIGNAPTALFHLLERLDDGWPRPAAILAFPVGFVGAAESKAELAANPRGTAFLTLRGRRGGSAMASAAVNAFAAGLETA